MEAAGRGSRCTSRRPKSCPELLGALERFIHAEDDLPLLVRTGLLHVQFETLHPYLDGNGRIGRLLVTLLLEHWSLLSQPLLYLSLFFKRRRAEYYERLNAVRIEGLGRLARFLPRRSGNGRGGGSRNRTGALLPDRDRSATPP